jgi:hypothetical protein
MNKVKMLAMVVLTLALLIPTSVASAKTFKFTFDPVTFSDGTQGVIEAGTKEVNKGDFTVCDYYTTGYLDYLGQYQNATFFSSDASTLENFCLAHYADRQ